MLTLLLVLARAASLEHVDTRIDDHLLHTGNCTVETRWFDQLAELPVMCCTTCPPPMLLDTSVWLKSEYVDDLFSLCGKCVSLDDCLNRHGVDIVGHRVCALKPVFIS